MVLQSLRLRKFRSYDDASFMFKDGVNVVIGLNGAGKTNLLESVYISMHGSSFRVADKELAQYGSEWFRIDATFDGQSRTIRYQTAESPPKQITINDAAKKRFVRSMRLPVVLFDPDMLRVLSGSPARRRRLLDEFVASWFDDGNTVLRRYERVLLQRNNILKEAYRMNDSELEDQLFAWDMSFAELAGKIEQYRAEVIQTINLSISEIYSKIADRVQRVELIYQTSSRYDRTRLLSLLQSSRRLDVARGYTTIGPHRNDFVIHLNGQPVGITASRGEQRSLVLALKYIEAVELERLFGTMPILLLDDITGELDTWRVKSLLEMVKHYQVVATAAHSDDLLLEAANHKIAL